MKISRAFSFTILNILFGIGLTAGSTLIQHHNSTACRGGLDAGFPIVFICDDSASSPVSSWGKIDLADWGHINARPFLLDFLMYGALVSLIWIIAVNIFIKASTQNEYLKWGVLFCFGYILAFLFAFTAFQSVNLNFDRPFPRTPTPTFFTPTPIETIQPTPNDG